MTQAIDLLLAPSGLMAVFVILAGTSAAVFRKKRTASIFLAIAALIYMVFGSSATTMWLMGHLEQEFPPLQDSETTVTPEFMVVLAGYARFNAERPISGQVNSASGLRLLEAARLYARTRKMTVLISGHEHVPEIMSQLLVQLGVPRTSIVTESGSENTYESAVNLREQLAGKSFYLVTSAGHMPRSLRIFRKQGLSPIPAPTDYLSPVVLADTGLLPVGRNLAISDQAVHEYLGMLWYGLLGRI